MKWNFKSSIIPQTKQELVDILLANREIDDVEEFLQPPPPNKITLKEVGLNIAQVKLAVSRIMKAVKDQERVVIYGDYDADGICATAIIWQTLNHLGLQAVPFIPHRKRHGYGISHPALDQILQKKKPDLIITVDNGIVAYEPLQRLKKEKIDVIVSDHHQPDEKQPPALSIVHTTQLSGAAVAWMLAKELAPNFSIELLDLAGIATIADMVPLVKANRSFAKFGIKALRQTRRVGLVALFKMSGVNQKKITSLTVGFRLAPRINAMGRLDHGLDALRLLCTPNSSKADKLAVLLNETNQQRQLLTEELIDVAQQQAQKQEAEKIIIVSSTAFHEGVVGLIAGQLTQKYFKPAIAISLDEKIGKASARSIAGVNIVELIRQVRDDLIDVGGHPMAAGFSLLADKLETVQQRLFKLARDEIGAHLLDPSLEIDCWVPHQLLSPQLIEAIQTLAPFGSAVPQPVVAVNNLIIRSISKIGKKRQHLRLIVVPQEDELAQKTLHQESINCLAWSRAELADSLSPGDVVAVAGNLQLNSWKGKTTTQLVLKDIRSSATNQKDNSSS